MLAIIRVILFLMVSTLICIIGIIFCILNPRGLCYAAIFGRLFGSMTSIFGIKIEVRNLLEGGILPRNCIYIANHQNNYDMIVVTYVVQPRTITVGKRSLLWIPLFGQLYWLSGNILINRSKGIKSYNAFFKMVKMLKIYDISIWVFPEGTRNYGKELLQFKTGAFRAAISEKIPIVPVCVSNISNNKIRLNRWFNGLVIIEIMPIIDTNRYELHQARWVSEYCRTIMSAKFKELNTLVKIREEI